MFEAQRLGFGAVSGREIWKHSETTIAAGSWDETQGEQ